MHLGYSRLTSISSSRQLPKKLYELVIRDAPRLDLIAERFHDSMNLQSIWIDSCKNLKCIPADLDKLSHLERITISHCPNIVCFPEGGIPNTILNVSISNCEKLEALPNGFHCLDSLGRLQISGCSSIVSFTDKGFPTNLRSLHIQNNEKMYKEVVEWGFHYLTSLENLLIDGLDAESFPQEEMQLPPTLTELTIRGFPRLKYLSSKGFKHLMSLQYLRIINCPNVTSFPKQGLLSSLLELHIYKCPLLKEECERNKGKEWSKISHIPYVHIDERFIYEEED